MSALQDLPAPLRALFGDRTSTVAPEHIRWALAEYGRRMSRGDAKGVVELFASDGYILDPVGTMPRRGADLLQFYQGSFDAMNGFIEMRLDGEVRIAGKYGAAAYIARMTIDGQDVKVETLDVMEFDDAGKFASMHAYWGPPNVKAGRAPERLE